MAEVSMIFAVVAFVALWALSIWLALRAVKWLRDDIWTVMDRCDKAANKAEHIEMRPMRNFTRAHELVRCLYQLVEEFDEDLSATYLMRQFSDLMTQFIEVRMRFIAGGRNEYGDLCHLLRYCLRVTFDRFVVAEDHPTMRRFRKLAEYVAQYFSIKGNYPYADEALFVDATFTGDAPTEAALRNVALRSIFYEVRQLSDGMRISREFWN